MRRPCVNWLVLGVILSVLCPCAAEPFDASPKGELGPSLRIRVRVFNYAGVTKAVLSGAKKQASGVLRTVDVETVWVDCPTFLGDSWIKTACRGHLAAAELVIRIVPRSTNPRYPLGFAALPTEKHEVASHASVFFEAAEELAAGYPASTAQTLGHIMAHEIGHLLLGVGSHSRRGLMRAPWRKQEMELAARGALGFTADQRTRIRQELSRRLVAAPR